MFADTRDPRADAGRVLPATADAAVLVGRLWAPGRGPRLVAVAGGRLADITALGPTMADLIERADPAAAVRERLDGAPAGDWDLAGVLTAGAAEADRRRGAVGPVDRERPACSRPVDLQVLKAARGDVRAQHGRARHRGARGRRHDARAAGSARARGGLGGSIGDVRPGSPEAAKVELLARTGLWSQYLEVGIGSDAEVFTKGPLLSGVGHGRPSASPASRPGTTPSPSWRSSSTATAWRSGATLGNDANLRDIEGSSALLLPLAKDNNAAAALGPFIRLLDDGFRLTDAAATTITMRIDGPTASCSRPQRR